MTKSQTFDTTISFPENARPEFRVHASYKDYCGSVKYALTVESIKLSRWFDGEKYSEYVVFNFDGKGNCFDASTGMMKGNDFVFNRTGRTLKNALCADGYVGFTFNKNPMSEPVSFVRLKNDAVDESDFANMDAEFCTIAFADDPFKYESVDFDNMMNLIR